MLIITITVIEKLYMLIYVHIYIYMCIEREKYFLIFAFMYKFFNTVNIFMKPNRQNKI